MREHVSTLWTNIKETSSSGSDRHHPFSSDILFRPSRSHIDSIDTNMCNEQLGLAILKPLSTLISENKCMIRFVNPLNQSKMRVYQMARKTTSTTRTLPGETGGVCKATVTKEEKTDCFAHPSHQHHCSDQSDVTSLPEVTEKLSATKTNHTSWNLIVLNVPTTQKKKEQCWLSGAFDVQTFKFLTIQQPWKDTHLPNFWDKYGCRVSTWWKNTKLTVKREPLHSVYPFSSSTLNLEMFFSEKLVPYSTAGISASWERRLQNTAAVLAQSHQELGGKYKDIVKKIIHDINKTVKAASSL